MKWFDLIAIVRGPAGKVDSSQAAKLGKSMAIVERQAAIGGVLLHIAKIPSKTLRSAMLYLTG